MAVEVNRAVKPRKSYGNAVEDYELVNIVKPMASTGHVVVKVVLRPVNPTDIAVYEWGLWANLDTSQLVVGSEGVGVVVEVGEGVTNVEIGDRVIPMTWNRYYPTGYGLWRDFVEIPEVDAVPVPCDLSDEIAAQFIVNPWCALGLLQKLDIPKGGWFLQQAAASVLGRLMISLAKHYGIKSINVVRRDKWIQPLKDLGADYVINSSTEDVKARVKEITGGEGAYGAVDPLGGEETRVLASSVRDGGQVLVYGGLTSGRASIDTFDLLRGVTLTGFLINDFSQDLRKRADTVRVIGELLSKKILDPLVAKTYPLEDFKEAMQESQREGHGGKVLFSSY